MIKQKEDMGFECTQIDREFGDIQQSVKGMVKMFNKAKISAVVADQYSYDDNI